MSSLADLPELIGFFSYSREDDEDSHGALSALRTRIQGELRGQLGRTAKTFRLWQDKEAIPSGTLWETEIKNAVTQAVFFIPIITPTVIASPYCRIELESFLAREAELGREDLVFPILYIDVPALEDAARRQNDPVLSLVTRRQYADWSEFRYLDVNSTEVRRAVGRFCADIRNSLQRPWSPPAERNQPEQAAVVAKEQTEPQYREAEIKHHADERASQSTAEEGRGLEAEAELSRAESERQNAERERSLAQSPAKRSADSNESRDAQPPPLPQKMSRPALILGSLLGVMVLGTIAAWLTMPATRAPVAPRPAPVPATPSVAAITPIPGLSVGFGDTIDKVRAAYKFLGDSTNGCGSRPCIMFTAPEQGLRFFFSTKSKLLYLIRADAPFSGNIQGVRIGDASNALPTRFGKPYASWDGVYVFHVDGESMRCDFADGKVTSILIWTKRDDGLD